MIDLVHTRANDVDASLRPMVSAVMPCLNEARTIGVCITKAQRAISEMGVPGEVIVADNGSTDGSIEIAERLGARVVYQTTRGYGAALIKGINAARGDYIVMADADDSYDWSGIQTLVCRLESGSDLVVGNRFAGGIAQGAMPFLHRYLGNPVLSWLARLVHGARLTDFHCGMRAFRRDAVDAMRLRTTGMEFATEMIVNAQKAGLRISEVPVPLNKDGRGRPPHLRSFRDGWRHVRFILTYGPNYLYLAPGIIMFLAGLLLVAVLANGPVNIGTVYLGIHFLALGSLLTLLGFNILNLGVLAKLIARSVHPGANSRISNWIIGHFKLEAGVALGLILCIIGAGMDIAILVRWLSNPALPMDDTVHVGFVATLAVVLGANTIFSSFLLDMLTAEHRGHGTPEERTRPNAQ